MACKTCGRNGLCAFCCCVHWSHREVQTCPLCDHGEDDIDIPARNAADA